MICGNKDKAICMAKYAYKTVPIYKNYAEEKKLNIEDISYEEIPKINKSFLLKHGMSILSTQYMGKYVQNKLIHTRTSGSTGTYADVFWDPMEKRRSLLSLWLYRKHYYGITPSDKLCYFYPSYDGNIEYYETANKLAISKILFVDNDLEEILFRINKSRPDWMILQPSFASMLCGYIEKNQSEIPDSIRYIEFTGEYLEESVRKRTKEIFRCRIANQYGSKEVNSIAYECPQGHLHIMEDNVLIEISDNQKEGEIYLTTLHNKAMPMVRFNIGDRGRVRHDINCSCGNKGSILELKTGRDDDWILRKDGTKIHAYKYMQIVQKINYEMDGEILQFQIVQKDWNVFIFHLVIEEKQMEQRIAERLYNELNCSIDDQTIIKIQFHDHLIPDKKTGKLACFYCEI